MVLTHVDLIEKLLHYNRVYSQSTALLLTSCPSQRTNGSKTRSAYNLCLYYFCRFRAVLYTVSLWKFRYVYVTPDTLLGEFHIFIRPWWHVKATILPPILVFDGTCMMPMETPTHHRTLRISR